MLLNTEYQMSVSVPKSSGSGSDDRLDQILEQLHKLNEKQARNAANIKAIARKMMEEENDTGSFAFPLSEPDEYEKFNNCLAKKRFSVKLVSHYVSIKRSLFFFFYTPGKIVFSLKCKISIYSYFWTILLRMNESSLCDQIFVRPNEYAHLIFWCFLDFWERLSELI